jgi:hypothetical protein
LLAYEGQARIPITFTLLRARPSQPTDRNGYFRNHSFGARQSINIDSTAYTLRKVVSTQS